MASITLAEIFEIGILLLLIIFLIAIIFYLVFQRTSDFKKATPQDFQAISGENTAATRLDLARAYIEMQQFDQAAALLKQVVKMSDQVAKKEAQQLLEEIGY